MAHQTTAADPYARLQQRLDRLPTGAPDSPALQAILRLLFTAEEARLAARMPVLCSLRTLGERVGGDEDELDAMVTEMAGKGLVVDLEHRGQRWVMLAPVVIGFFEYTFMRVRPDAPEDELARLFDRYLYREEGHPLAHAVFRGSVQIGRSLVREEALPAEPATEVLGWERATTIVSSASTVAVSLCPCRRHAQLLGGGCDAPLRTCLTLGGAAEAMVRAGIAEAISTAEALDILTTAKAAGLAQTGDNVQRDVTYICNCCGCCCGMMQAIRRAGIRDAIVSSNWIATTDLDLCRGCTQCRDACPAQAVARIDNEGRGRRKYWAAVDEERCLGCGVCVDVCRWEARQLAPRPRRVFPPETSVDRVITMAVERGKLGDLLVDTLDGPGGDLLARVLQALERSAPAAALRAIEPLRSVFLRALLRVVHTGPAGA
jgi:NAD-dependent dihydropyrimidine dehydrogenase PreA subunit